MLGLDPGISGRKEVHAGAFLVLRFSALRFASIENDAVDQIRPAMPVPRSQSGSTGLDCRRFGPGDGGNGEGA